MLTNLFTFCVCNLGMSITSCSFENGVLHVLVSDILAVTPFSFMVDVLYKVASA